MSSSTINTSSSSQRISILLNHIHPSPPSTLNNVSSRYDTTSLRLNGWGYQDTELVLDEKDGKIKLTGNRYEFSGEIFPYFREWAENNIGLKIDEQTPPLKNINVPSIVSYNKEFIEAIAGCYEKISSEEKERVFHAHGHSCQEVFDLRYGKITRVPDCVLWPGNHESIVKIVAMAVKYNIVLLPFGGGTTVTHALLIPENEKRMVVALDMHMMNRLKWLNKNNMLACFEAGIIGKELEEKLANYGLCFGHEPDSHEFSSLGGWVATRASGMKKNVYGNMEDLIVNIKFVTPTGVIERSANFPRVSFGPDLFQIVLGSEGSLGIVTEVTIKVRPLPVARQYGSIVFPDFNSGFKAMHEIGLGRHQPASIRLVDNEQFLFGQALKPSPASGFTGMIDKAKKFYVTQILKFDPAKMVATTLLFEGTPEHIKNQEKKVYAIAAKYGGIKGGAENGQRGYFLTFMIAYLRDFGFKYGFMAESFETSVPYDQVVSLCNNVKKNIIDTCKTMNVPGTPFVSCRVTQLYDTGACVYFYFGFMFKGLKDPVKIFSHVEHEARREILRSGGSLSHHHGVGKLRKEFMPETVGAYGVNILKDIKNKMDPTNIFANGNLL